MRVIDEEGALHPDDVEIREWRARVLAWSGRTEEAEKEWNEVLRVAPKDPDNWLGLANVYEREGRFPDAQHAIDTAVELDSKRADLHLARGRILRRVNNPREAKLEFERSLQLDPSNAEARAGLDSLQGEPKQALRIGENNDTFNFADANHDEWTGLSSQWTPHWATHVETSFYQRGGTGAGKFLGSVTGRSSRWGAFTVGGAAGHDNAVIPKSEAFFDVDHGFRLRETGWIRGAEMAYGQHWYWYEGARILSLNQTTMLYLPHDWTWSLKIVEARSHFSGIPDEWKTSGLTKLGFPLGHWRSRSLSGATLFAVGTENFAQVDQIGSFASRTYGGELTFQFTQKQDLKAYSFYQERTQDRTQTGFGFSYGIRF